MSDGTEPRSRDSGTEPSVRPRPADHAAIDRLAADLLPALVARLSATGLGEIEIRQDAWRVRVRRPAGGSTGSSPARRSSDRPSRTQPGHEGHGHAPGALEGHRSARSVPGGQYSANGSASSAGHAPPPGGGVTGNGRRQDAHRAVATSPAVGIFQPRSETGSGSRVRAGDRIGTVEMLGVPQEVVAPADGIVTDVLAAAGDAVEYGQDLIVLERSGGSTGPGER